MVVQSHINSPTVKTHQSLGVIHLIILLNFISICSSIKGSKYAVLRGSNIRLSCIPKNVQVEGESDIRSSYTWLDGDNKEVIDARFTKLASGELEIINAHITDSGIYTCKFRSPTAWSDKNTMEKDFQHKLVVYQIAGHTFYSTVFFDLSLHTAEGTETVLSELLKSRVCGNDLCVPGSVKSKKCAPLETGIQACQFLLIYRGIEALPDEQCDEDCVGEIMFDSLKRAETSLKSALVAEIDNPRSLLKPDMKSFETKHVITCKPGFRLVQTHHKRCFPCFPGSYSKRNSMKCQKCAEGFFQEHFGKHDCEKCEDGKTTDSVGAKSKQECVKSTANVFNDIKDGIAKIFSG